MSKFKYQGVTSSDLLEGSYASEKYFKCAMTKQRNCNAVIDDLYQMVGIF